MGYVKGKHESQGKQVSQKGCQIWHPNWVRLAPNGIKLGLLKISFSTFWPGELIEIEIP